MHTLLLLTSFLWIYFTLKQKYRQISQATHWTQRAAPACYILCSSGLILFAVTLNATVMSLTGCLAFHTHRWDTVTSLTIGALAWLLLGISIIRSIWSQRKVHRVLALVNPCQHTPALDSLRRLAEQMLITQPQLLTFQSDKPYAATLFYKRPVLLLSSWMLTHLDEEELESVLAHELAHIHRKDNLMVTICGILKDVLYFLPIIQKTWQKFLVDLETAADDVAVLTTQKPMALASAILKVHQAQPQMEFAYGIRYFTPNALELEERVERLLTPDIQQTAQHSRIRLLNLLFSKELWLLIFLLALILGSICILPYCHWILSHSG